MEQPQADIDRETRQDVTDLLVRYATAIDQRDWALFRSCFTEDCDADYGDIGHWDGVDALASWMEQVHAPCGHTLHRITNQSVVADPTGVTACSYVDAIVMGPDNRTGTHAIGYYDDELRGGVDGWKISRRTFTMVLVEPVGGPGLYESDDIRAIERLKARYFRTMDSKEWDAMREVLADDIVMDTTASGGNVITGAVDFIAFLREAIGDVVTTHHGNTPEITITSPTTATGVWAMEDMLRWPDGTELHGYGHYDETYEKVDGQWCIKTSTLTRLRMDIAEPK